MFLTMGIVLGVISTFTEVKMVHGIPFVARLYEHGLTIWKWKIEGIIFNTLGSFVLSWILGLMFAADGLTVMFGAITSTGFSQMYFSSEKYAHSMGWSVKGFKAGVTTNVLRFRSAKTATVKLYHDFRQPIKDITSFVLLTLKFITFPFVVVRRISAAYSQRMANP